MKDIYTNWHHPSLAQKVAVGSVIFCLSLLLLVAALLQHYKQVQEEYFTYRKHAENLVQHLEGLETLLVTLEKQKSTLDQITKHHLQATVQETGLLHSLDQRNTTLDMIAETLQSPPAATQNMPSLPTLLGLSFDAARLANQLYETHQTILTRQELLNALPLLKPSQGWISSGFGRRPSPFTGEMSMHQGIDIASPRGSPVYATADGKVSFSGWLGGYGRLIELDHGFGIRTRYAHLDRAHVARGEQVRRGQLIGSIGMTGRTLGPHLHYEIWAGNQPVDPYKFFAPYLDSEPVGPPLFSAVGGESSL